MEEEHSLKDVDEREVADPLSQTTRRERTWLLLANGALFAMVHAGLIPQEISALGLRATDIDADRLVLLTSLVVIYLGSGFVFSARADRRAWKSKLLKLEGTKRASGDAAVKHLRNAASAALAAGIDVEQASAILSDNLEERWVTVMDEAWNSLSRPYRFRAGYEFWVPTTLTVLNLVSVALAYLLRALF